MKKPLKPKRSEFYEKADYGSAVAGWSVLSLLISKGVADEVVNEAAEILGSYNNYDFLTNKPPATTREG